MLDNPKKTEPLLVALKAAAPFEVELMPALIEHLRAENIAALNEIRQTVSDVSYAGDEGGIVCHNVPSDRREALVVCGVVGRPEREDDAAKGSSYEVRSDLTTPELT